MRTLEGKLLNGNVLYAKIAGLSTETKPTGLAMGSEFREVDTGDTYTYNETSGEWVGGSSDGGSDDTPPAETVEDNT